MDERARRIAMTALLMAMLMSSFSQAMLGTVLAVRLKLAGFPDTMPALLSTVGFAGLLLGSLTAHFAIKRFGHVTAMLVASLCVAAATVGYLYLPPPWTWMALRFLVGSVGIWMWVGGESWMQSITPNAIRGKTMSLFMICHAGGMGVGQFLVDVFDPLQSALFWIAVAATLSAALPILFIRHGRPQISRPQFLSPLALFRLSPLAVVGSILAGAITGTAIGLGPVFGLAREAVVGGVGVFMFVLLTSGILFQWPVGRLSDRMDRRLLLVLVYGAILSFALLALYAQSGNTLLMYVAAVGIGGSMRVIYPICSAFVHDGLTQEQRVSVSGGVILAWSAGAVVGPYPAGWVMEAFGPGGLFGFIAAIAALAALFGLWRLAFRNRPVSAALDRP
ncbi:MAG: MFS transporter [Alphaproteobacteria bacterium]